MECSCLYLQCVVLIALRYSLNYYKVKGKKPPVALTSIMRKRYREIQFVEIRVYSASNGHFE